MSLVIQSINRPFSPANIYPSSFWLLCFIPTFITKTPTIPYQDAHYSLSEQGTSPYLSLAINYQLKIKRFFLSHLTLLFSIQSTFRERRFMIHLKYFLQICPPKIWWIQKSSTFAPAAQPHRGFHRTYSSFCGWLTLKYWRMKRK